MRFTKGGEERTNSLRDSHSSSKSNKLHQNKQGDPALPNFAQWFISGNEVLVSEEVEYLLSYAVASQRVQSHVPAARSQ